MKLNIYDNSTKSFSIEANLFRELYDILSWLGGYAGFPQFSGKVTEDEYETFIRNKDDRVFCWDKQKETNTIQFNILDNRKAVIELKD